MPPRNTIQFTPKINCEKCNLKYQHNSDFDIHKNKCEHEKKMFQCKVCSYVLSTKNKLTKHIKNHVGHICNVCISKGSLKLHIDNRHNDSHFKCLVCNKFFSSKANLKLHYIRITCTPEEKKAFACGKCQKRFRTKSGLKHHVSDKACSTGNKQKCLHCSKVLSNIKKFII